MSEKQNRDAVDGDKDGLVQDGTEFERPEGFVIGATDGDGDGMVQDGTVHERPVEEANVIPVMEEQPKVKKRVAKKVVEGGIPWSEDMDISMSKLVFESLFERNSRSVGLVQLRLVELGYGVAGADKRGWLSAGTKEALAEFAKDSGMSEATQYADQDVIEALFSGTPVRIVP